MLLTTSRTQRHDTNPNLLPAGPAQDVVRDACRAYNDLVDRDYRTLSATADEWFEVGRKLSSASELLTGDRRYFVSSRAVDAEARGRRTLIVNGGTLRAVSSSFLV